MTRKRKSQHRGRGNYMNHQCLCDLNIPLVLNSNSGGAASLSLSSSNKKKAKPTKWKGQKEELNSLICMAENLGYSLVAVSNLVHNQVKESSDQVFGSNIVSVIENAKKRQKASCDKNTLNDPIVDIKILKRLNVVIEQTSDLVNFSDGVNDKMKSILNSYDIIALSPRNETVFTAICNSKNLIYSDIIILDYTSGRGGVQLPFRLKKADISAASSMGLSFEIPYAAAIIDPTKRKAFIQTARQFSNASFGLTKPTPRVIISSGSRILDGRDYGAMSLRNPSDLLNICKVMLGFQDHIVSKMLRENATEIIQRGQNRKNGKVCHLNLTFEVLNSNEVISENMRTARKNLKEEVSSDDEDDGEQNIIQYGEIESDTEEGFLMLS